MSADELEEGLKRKELNSLLDEEKYLRIKQIVANKVKKGSKLWA